MTDLSPVLVFAYRRPDHLRRTLDALMRCKEFDNSPVIIYCDGARGPEDAACVVETRKLAKEMLGEHAEYHFSDVNLGLSRSVISGVTDVIHRYGRVIVVEDDLSVNPYFLTFMNRALDRYSNEKQVFQISGYMFDVSALKLIQSAVFFPFTVSWGWATWKRAWDEFDPMASGWEALYNDRQLRYRFNLDGSYDYATMLIRQMTGMRDSWAIRWYWTVFKKKGLVLFPPASLVSNTGFDGSGTHGRGMFRRFSQTKAAPLETDISLPASICVDADRFAGIKKRLKHQNGGHIGAFVNRVRQLLNI